MIVRLVTRHDETREVDTRQVRNHELNTQINNFFDIILKSLSKSQIEGKNVEIKVSNFK